MRAGAIILAGGRGSRLGGVRKADLRIGGERLLDRVLSAVEGCEPRIVVGYEDLEVPGEVLLTREDPPGSGPAAGIAAGVELLGENAAWVLTLACDLPGVSAAVPLLLGAAEAADESTEAISASSENRLEWLVSIHRTRSLRRAITNHQGGVVNCSMRRLYSGLQWKQVAAPPASTHDIDTWEDHDQWQ